MDIFAASEGGASIVEENLDECVLCGLCLDAAPPAPCAWSSSTTAAPSWRGRGTNPAITPGAPYRAEPALAELSAGVAAVTLAAELKVAVAEGPRRVVVDRRGTRPPPMRGGAFHVQGGAYGVAFADTGGCLGDDSPTSRRAAIHVPQQPSADVSRPGGVCEVPPASAGCSSSAGACRDLEDGSRSSRCAARHGAVRCDPVHRRQTGFDPCSRVTSSRPTGRVSI